MKWTDPYSWGKPQVHREIRAGMLSHVDQELADVVVHAFRPVFSDPAPSSGR